MLFNEPKLLKFDAGAAAAHSVMRFSALQRAEIAEMVTTPSARLSRLRRFSALQRAEIAEIRFWRVRDGWGRGVSVLFNEPKLLK